MIRFKVGDMMAEDAEALVNTVNCVGIMGRGIALQFKKTFPDNFRAYAQACRAGQVRPGQVFVFEIGAFANPRWIMNFPTKRHWRGNSRMEDIDSGLKSLVEAIRQRDIRSIAIPPLGSGLGGLDWNAVRPRIERAMRDLDNVHITVFEPNGGRSVRKNLRAQGAPDMTKGRAALVSLMRCYLNGLLDPFVTLLEIHKLLYFMQAAGEPLRLRFVEGSYGPYAENLRHVLHEMEGHFMLGFADGGDEPYKPFELFPEAVAKAEAVMAGSHRTREHFDRVVSLVDGFESPSGLELLATVHWVLERDASLQGEQLVAKVHDWNARKSRFSPGQIELAADVLARKGWIDRCPSPRR